MAYLVRYDGYSRDRYSHYLRTWLAWCADADLDPLEDVRRVHVEIFIQQHLLGRMNLRPNSARTAMCAVRGFYELAHDDGVIARDPARRARLPKRSPPDRQPWLGRQELRYLLEVARDTSPRHYAFVALFTAMGLRVSEACSIDVPNIYNVEQGFRVLRFTGKQGKPAAMPIPTSILEALETAAGDRIDGPLLLMKGDERTSRTSAYQLVQTIQRRSGVGRHINPHLLRKAAITVGLQAGISVGDMRYFARHADDRTILRYYDMRPERFATHPVHQIGAMLAIEPRPDYTPRPLVTTGPVSAGEPNLEPRFPI